MSDLLAGGACLLLAEGLGLNPAWRPGLWIALAGWWLIDGLTLPAMALLAVGLAALIPDRRSDERERWELCRFWQRVAVLLSAGLSMAEAVEEAAPTGPWGQDIRHLVNGLAWGDRAASAHFLKRHGSPEGHMVCRALETGWRHGLDADATFAQARAALGRLAQDARLRAATAPLWNTLLPAVLLLALLAMMAVPLGEALGAGFAHL